MNKPNIYRVVLTVESYIQAHSPEEADRIAHSRRVDIVENDGTVIDVDDEPITESPSHVKDSLPWVSYLYDGPEYTVQQVIDLNK